MCSKPKVTCMHRHSQMLFIYITKLFVVVYTVFTLEYNRIPVAAHFLLGRDHRSDSSQLQY